MHCYRDDHAIFREIAAERLRQDGKWGQQNHPDGTGGLPLYTFSDVNLDMRSAEQLARIFRNRCEYFFEHREGTWRDILLEEVFETIAESGPVKLRAELLQVAAVAVAWVEAIDRRQS